MLSERDIELAHPEAFDFVWGNLPPAERAEFNRHLGGCRYCQGVVDEYSEIGQIIKNLPPHVEPPADLEDRTVAAMVAALAEQRAKTDRRSDARGPSRHPGLPDSRGSSSGRARDLGPAETAAPASGRAAGPADGHPPACVATLPRPYRRCRCRRRCHHHCPPWCSRSALAGDGSPRFKLHSRDPALCHRRRQASSSRFRENFDKPGPRSSEAKTSRGAPGQGTVMAISSLRVSARRCCRPAAAARGGYASSGAEASDRYRSHQLRGHSGAVHGRLDGRTESTSEGTSDGRPDGRPEGWRGRDDVPELGAGAGRGGAGLLLEAGLLLGAGLVL